MMRLAERKRLISRNPFLEVDFLKQKNRRQPHILSFEEEERILAVALPFLRALIVEISKVAPASGSPSRVVRTLEFVSPGRFPPLMKTASKPKPVKPGSGGFVARIDRNVSADGRCRQP